MIFKKFPKEYQYDAKDCGPACLKMVARHFGRVISLQELRERCGITREGVSLLGISAAAESVGLHSMAFECNIGDLISKVPLPAIVHWNDNHFVVVYGACKKGIHVSDPLKGHVRYSPHEFESWWSRRDDGRGVVLALEPTVDFLRQGKGKGLGRDGLERVLLYFLPYRRQFLLVAFVMVLSTLLQGLLPFISKAVIDVGINTGDVHFVNMMLIGNVSLLLGIMSFGIVRDWILLHITARVNIALVSDYLTKLMGLPITFFEDKLVGDILQRAQDHERIRGFIMNNSLSLVFSSLTFVAFSVILLAYHSVIFCIFMACSVVYVGWVLMFLSIRKRIDWEYFDVVSKNQSYWVETISSIQDIKLYNYERVRRWKWEGIQTRLYHINKNIMTVGNIQNFGAGLIENVKNMVITFFCATAVIKGDISFGVMISTQFILGMLNGPLAQFINFVVSAQYAKLSFMRMNEIREMDDEDAVLSIGNGLALPEDRSIRLTDVMFRYSPHSPLVLKGINLVIPENKVTAIVGASGCGKSTLLKVLARLYKPSYGTVNIGHMNAMSLGLSRWREVCAVVMQDGKLFTDTIRNNIVLTDGEVDYGKLRHSCKIAQILDDIEQLPKGFDTEIGERGRGLSGGQRQRILIARALYHDPSYLFLDEATNSLDTVNEQKIVSALDMAFENRTVVVIAHRLSTIRNAHQIVVMDNGRIAEVGTHSELLERHGAYFDLVMSQQSLNVS